jgi:hypothetical protein
LTLALLAALVVVVIADRWLADRKDKRHAAQVDRLLMWRHDPHTASLPEKTEVPLYLPPEDDDAWNKAHRGDE